MVGMSRIELGLSRTFGRGAGNFTLLNSQSDYLTGRARSTCSFTQHHFIYIK